MRDGKRALVLPEITLQRMTDPAHVLNRDRLIEPVVVPDLREDLRIPVLAAERKSGVAGERADAQEDEEARDRQDDQGGSELSQNEAAHDLPQALSAVYLLAKATRINPSPKTCTPFEFLFTPV